MTRDSIKPTNPRSGRGPLNPRAPDPRSERDPRAPEDGERPRRAGWRIYASFFGVIVALLGLLLCAGFFADMFVEGTVPTSPDQGFWEGSRPLIVGLAGFLVGTSILLALRPGRPGASSRSDQDASTTSRERQAA